MLRDSTRIKDPVKHFTALPENELIELVDWLFEAEAERRKKILRALSRMEEEEIAQVCELSNKERDEIMDDLLAEQTEMMTAEESRDIYRISERLRLLHRNLHRKTA